MLEGLVVGAVAIAGILVLCVAAWPQTPAVNPVEWREQTGPLDPDEIFLPSPARVRAVECDPERTALLPLEHTEPIQVWEAPVQATLYESERASQP